MLERLAIQLAIRASPDTSSLVGPHGFSDSASDLWRVMRKGN